MSLLKFTLTLVLCTLGFRGLAQPQFSFDAASQSGSAATTLTFKGTLVNTGNSTAHLNGVMITLNGFSLDDSPFLFGAPQALGSNQSFSGIVFTVSIPGDMGAGSYNGNFSVLGGADAGAFNVLTNTSFTVTIDSKTSQTITFGSIPGKRVGDPPFALGATASSGLPVSYTSSNPAVAVVSGGTLTIVGAGNSVITASQTGDDTYAPASDVPQTLSVGPGTATIILAGLSSVYDGTPKVATVTTTPANVPVAITYNGSATAPANAGSYAVVATINSPNYTGSASGTLVITPATASVALGNLTQTFDGSPKAVSVSTIPVGLSTSVSYGGNPTAPTSIGAYPVVATVTNPNYFGSASATLNITQAVPTPATVTLGSLAHTYDGTPKAATATTNPAGLSIAITYDGSATAPTAAGSYSVVATITAPSHIGSTSGMLIIGKATAGIVFSQTNATYDGSPKPVIVSTTPASLPAVVTYDGSSTAPTNAGSYGVVATVNDVNYQGSASVTLLIAKATATIALGNLTHTFDSSPKPVTVSTTPAGLAATVTYDGGASVPSAVGSYAIVATISNPNYTGTATGTLVINPVVSVPVNVTDSLTITPGGFRLNRTTQRFVQTVTVQNTSDQPVAGPVSLVLDQLSSNAVLFGSAGITSALPPAGSSYVNLNVGTDQVLSPGEAISLSLEFSNPANQNITYVVRALAGAGNR